MGGARSTARGGGGGGTGWVAATVSDGSKEVRSESRESRSKSDSGGPWGAAAYGVEVVHVCEGRVSYSSWR